MQTLKELLSYGVRRGDIGVITPYSAQVNLIKKCVRNCPELHEVPQFGTTVPNIEVSTVDGF